MVGFLIVFISFSSVCIFPEKVAVLKDLLKPNRIYMDNNYMYVTEREVISVFSLDDYKLINKFGKKGEGPKEFLSPFYILPLDNRLFINSLGKISFYTKEGEHISELRSPANGRNFYPLGDGYAGFVNNIIDKQIYFTVNLYNHKLKFVRELYREKTPVRRAGKIELFRRSFMHKTWKHRLYVTGKDGFIMDCLSRTGEVLFTIKRDRFKKHRINSEDIENANKYFKLRYGDNFEQIKHQIVYPEYFPEIRDFKIADDKIFILPYEWNETGLKFYIYSVNGKFISEQYIPLALMYSMQPYPFSIQKNRVYQIIENEETEEWELHVNDLNL